MLERESAKPGPAYWEAYERWKKLSSKGLKIDAAHCLSREEAHAHRR